jgi:hypothetical protein
MKQTAVEWLVEQYFGNIKDCTPRFRYYIEQAKEMEKEQLKECWKQAQEEQRKEFSSSYVSIKFDEWYENK